MFSYTRRLGSFLGVKILNFNIFIWNFRKINTFGVCDDFVDIFGVITKLD